MGYCKGEFVMYAANGVCQVTDIRDEVFSGDNRTYYVLAPVGSVSQVYVPVDNASLTSRMRPLMTKSQIESAVREAKGETHAWIVNARLRGQHFQEVLSRCETKELLAMVYSIYARKAEMASLGKRSLLVDDAALKKAEKILFGEASMVLGIPLAEVGEYIR